MSIFTFYCGIVFNDENTTNGGRILLSVLLIVVNSVLAIAFFTAMYAYADRFTGAKLKLMNAADIPAHSFARMVLFISILFEQTASNFSARVRKLIRPRNLSSRHLTDLNFSEQTEHGPVVPLEALEIEAC